MTLLSVRGDQVREGDMFVFPNGEKQRVIAISADRGFIHLRFEDDSMLSVFPRSPRQVERPSGNGFEAMGVGSG